MNVMLQPPEIRYVVEDSDIRLLATFDAFVPQVEAAIADLERRPEIVVVGTTPTADRHVPFAALLQGATPAAPRAGRPDDPILTLYTSGTTGKPKGAVISNANLKAQLEMTDEVFVPGDQDRTLCVLPLFHVFALNGILISAIRNGGTVVLHPRFEVDETIRSLAEDEITLFAGVPTMYFYILEHPSAESVRFPKLRFCFSGGAAMPVEVMRQFEERFGVEIYEGYGLTETTVSVCCNRPGLLRKPGSIGVPYSGVEMKILGEDGRELPDGEIGEIVVRAANVMLGYLGKPEATAEAIRDGWFHTGDLGHRDADGHFFIVDRKKDMIIKGGFNIYPREIEEVIYQLPQVAEAAVIGVGDAAKGETVRALIAIKPGNELDAETVNSHLASNLARYKIPQDIVFVDELPKGPTGKILKRELRDAAGSWSRERPKPRQSAS
jgi:long-chain acyl-CoA synthetase